MVYFTGDIHGSPFKLQVFCRYMELTEKDTIVILGDVGANYYGGKRDKQFKEQIAKLAPTIFCIHGNHEQRPANIPSYKAKEWNDGPVWYEEEYPNLLFARDGNIYVIDGVRYLVIGGAFSVDKNYRLSRGYGWWADEQPSEEIKARVGRRVANSGLDVILSHTCPFKYEPREAFLPGIDQSEVDSSTEEWLDTIEESVDYKAWFCGHWHIDKRIDKMHFLYDEFESDEWLQTMIKEEQNG
ncbi:MAG: Calcineurin-like phosphoesterase superfamily domain protein [Firmicutes bacterium ADurb.Bin300]|nr:MAG: Calcineurin-like phosphoesterase superfamily domain protein [Firmicutes bacterium ADurb.Bin300]